MEGSGGISHGIPVYHGTYGMGWICRTLSLGRDLVVYPMGSQCTMVHVGRDGHIGPSLGRKLVVHPMRSQCTMVHMGWDGYVGL